MGQIQLLEEIVANQIAAGEVVERPASVVKELVENAIDAGAQKVSVRVEDGGLSLITVTDDGAGMDRADAELCLERHATSKIRVAEDLNSVTTMGFRGEALASIASVSRMTVVTRRAEDQFGTKITAEGGKNRAAEVEGAPVGTAISVQELFFNVPARRKFLKRATTELSHITENITRLALANPNLAFDLKHGSREILMVPPESSQDPRGRLGRLVGREIAQHLYPLQPRTKTTHATVSGYFAAPEFAQRHSRGLFCFVNGRFVRDRTLLHAIQEAYRSLLETGQHPFAILFIEVEPHRVDVNVHPQKTEVRFEDSQEIHRIIYSALTESLAKEPWRSRHEVANIRNKSVTELYPHGGSPRDGGLREGSSEQSVAFAQAITRQYGAAASVARERGGYTYNQMAAVLDFRTPQSGRDERADNRTTQKPLRETEQSLKEGTFRFGELQPIGQVFSTYLLCQSERQLVIIDQHAAHERICYERLRREHAEKTVRVQALLVPLVLELPPTLAAVAESQTEKLLEIGFELEAFGGASWLVKTVPAAARPKDVAGLVTALLEELAENGQLTPWHELVKNMFAKAACHGSVRAGDRLNNDEIAALLAQMDEVAFSAYCPHGRPVFQVWREQDLARMFHRT